MRFYVVGKPYKELKSPACCGLFTKNSKTPTKDAFYQQLKDKDKHRAFATMAEAEDYAASIYPQDIDIPIIAFEMDTGNRQREKLTLAPEKTIEFVLAPLKAIRQSMKYVEFYRSSKPYVDFQYDTKAKCMGLC